MFNFIKKNLFIYLIAFLGISQFAYGNGEISAHFGKKFQTDGAWHFGVDALYRLSIDENSSFGIGPRYRFHFKSISASTSGNTNSSSSVKMNQHRLTLLTNYRYEMMESLFIGAILGVDIWKNQNQESSTIQNGNDTNSRELTSSEFLWNNFTAQFGVEVGYKITPNFLVKLEGGYDLLSFKKCTFSQGSEEEKREGDLLCGKFSGAYATVGLGYHF